MLHRIALAEQKVVARALGALWLTTAVEIVVILTAQMLSNAAVPANAVTERRGHTNTVYELKLADFVQKLAADTSMKASFARNSRAHRLGEGKQLFSFPYRQGVRFDRLQSK